MILLLFRTEKERKSFVRTYQTTNDQEIEIDVSSLELFLDQETDTLSRAARHPTLWKFFPITDLIW